MRNLLPLLTLAALLVPQSLPAQTSSSPATATSAAAWQTAIQQRREALVANNGPGGGNNTGAGFPNGRRLQDDVIDTILTIVNNGSPLGDNVNGNDVAFRDVFPYLAPAQQPRDPGVIDDNTRF